MRPKIKLIVEVVKEILQQQRTAEQSGSLTFPFTQSERVAVAEVVPQERISERISERTCEHSADVPVPLVARQAIQVQKV